MEECGVAATGPGVRSGALTVSGIITDNNIAICNYSMPELGRSVMSIFYGRVYLLVFFYT